MFNFFGKQTLKNFQRLKLKLSRQVQDQPAQQPEYYGGYQQYMYNTQTHSIFNPTGPQYSAESFSGAASGPPLAPTNLGKRHGLQPSGELPQVTIEQVKKRLKDRYYFQIG